MSIDPRWRIVLALASIWAASCTKRNPDLCCENDPECTAIGFSSFETCDLGVCVQNACTTEPNVCDDDKDCPDEVHHCVAGTCAACATSETCPTSAPVCDAAAHSCRGCVKDSECDSLACDLAAGTCVDAGRILYVAPIATIANPCTRIEPCSLYEAAKLVSSDRMYIAFLPGRHVGGVSFSAKTVIVCGNDAVLDTRSAGFYLYNGAVLTIRDLTLDQGTDSDGTPPIAITGSKVDLVRSRILIGKAGRNALVSHDADTEVVLHQSTIVQGIISVEGDLTVNRSTFLSGGGVANRGLGSLQISDSLFISTSPDVSITLFGGEDPPLGFVSFSHNTVIGGGISCSGESRYDKKIYGNILYGLNSLQSASGCYSDYNLVWPSFLLGGEHDRSADPLFVNPNESNYHLQSTSPAIDALPQPDDPAERLDYDGVRRPQGNSVDIGAFEFVRPN